MPEPAVTPSPDDFLVRRLEEQLRVPFNVQALAVEALTHQSVRNPRHTGDPLMRDNQQLAYLGDAVLALCVAEMQIERTPQHRSNKLAPERHDVVSNANLARIARQLDIGDLIVTLDPRARESEYTLATTLEAIIGAIYKMYGLNAARDFIERYVMPPKGA